MIKIFITSADGFEPLEYRVKKALHKVPEQFTIEYYSLKKPSWAIWDKPLYPRMRPVTIYCMLKRKKN